jgi:hypothetical protein
MDETKPEAEAWFRRKPKRIIHNQMLIQLLMVLAVFIPIPACGIIMYLIFYIAPAIVIPAILVLWSSAVVGEIIIWVLRRRTRVQSRYDS